MKIQVMGAGGWGIALARHLAHAGHFVSLWARNPNKAERLRNLRQDQDLLPDIILPEPVVVSTEPMYDVEMVVYAVPSQALKQVLNDFPFTEKVIHVSVSKGIETDSLLRMSERIIHVVPQAPVAVLSGPSHAEEVGRDLPTCVVVASKDNTISKKVQGVFGTPFFRVYTSQDIVGVEMGGALKNIIAIAAGACDGLALGDNAKAALITRGLMEMIRLGVMCGASPHTFAGLSGLGDLVVTCSSRHSRNYHVGYLVSQGLSLEDILKSSPKTAEGIRTVISAMRLAKQHGVEMPITSAVYEVLYEGANAQEAIARLMTRLMKAEWE